MQKSKWVIRNAIIGDINQSFFETLSNLAPVNADIIKAKIIFDKIKLNNNYNIFVAISEDGKIVGTATLLIQNKFSRDFEIMGHVEDVSVHKDYVKQGVGEALIHTIVKCANDKGCTVLVGLCKDYNVAFYEKYGATNDKNSNVMIFDLTKIQLKT